MMLKRDAKFEENLICCFKNDKNLVNFDPSTQFSKISFCVKYTNFDQKSTEKLSLMSLKSNAKFEEKLACGFEYDTRNLENFHRNI